MHERLSFYVKRDSVLHRLNPLTKLTLVLTLIFVLFQSMVLDASSSGTCGDPAIEFHRQGKHGIFQDRLSPHPACSHFFFFMQAFFQPVGEQVIFKFYFLDMTQESLMFAFSNAMRIFVMVSAFTIFLLTTHPSELMSDLTRRGLPGQFAYVIISTLQILPQIQAKAQTIISAQRSRGLDTEGSFFKRAGALVPLVGPLVFGSLVEVEERAIAIEARGFTSKISQNILA